MNKPGSVSILQEIFSFSGVKGPHLHRNSTISCSEVAIGATFYMFAGSLFPLLPPSPLQRFNKLLMNKSGSFFGSRKEDKTSIYI